MADLSRTIRDAAARRFLPVDGGWSRVQPWRPGLHAVVAFTGHAAISAPDEVSDADIDAWGADGFGGATLTPFMTRLAGSDGWIDYLNVLLVAHGTGGPSPLVQRPDLDGHYRAALARALRDDVVVHGRPGDDSAMVALSRGIGGLCEMSYELAPEHRGAGAALAREALTLVPEGEVVVASCTPGNAASLRALLGAGFEPVGSVQLYTRGPSPVA